MCLMKSAGDAEVGRGLRNHLENKNRSKAQEKFELVNIILPEIHDKAISILEAEPYHWLL